MRQNVFGGLDPPGSAGGAWALPQTPEWRENNFQTRPSTGFLSQTTIKTEMARFQPLTEKNNYLAQTHAHTVSVSPVHLSELIQI